MMNHYDYDRNKIKPQKSTRDVNSLIKWQFEFSFLTDILYILLNFSLSQ
jgi:hypothetical protein